MRNHLLAGGFAANPIGVGDNTRLHAFFAVRNMMRNSKKSPEKRLFLAFLTVEVRKSAKVVV
jgi:hypothetical protein